MVQATRLHLSQKTIGISVRKNPTAEYWIE